MGNRPRIVVGAGVVAVVLGAASLAWACTSQLGFGIQPGGGVAGAPVTGTGGNATGPVEVRWESVEGPVLAKVTPEAGTYVVGFTVPDVTPGVYTVVALSESANGTVAKSQAPFEVTPAHAAAGPSTRTVAADLWSGDQAPGSALAPVAPSGSSPSSLALGIGLLAGGMVTLGAGFAVAEARRRKAVVRSSVGH